MNSGACLVNQKTLVACPILVNNKTKLYVFLFLGFFLSVNLSRILIDTLNSSL